MFYRVTQTEIYLIEAPDGSDPEEHFCNLNNPVAEAAEYQVIERTIETDTKEEA